MPARAHGLSKSRYAWGLQCHRLLWWASRERDAPELVPDEALQAVFDQGAEVGALARAYVPGGVLVDAPYTDFAERLEQTRAALAAGARVLYEGAFSAGGVFVSTDILERDPAGWTLVEVKSSTSVKPQYLADAAVQAHVLRAAGLAVARVELMHLNRACVFPDLSDLFVRADLTAEVEALLPEVPSHADRMLAMLDGPLPAADIGPHCSEPYECPFRERCWTDLPEHHVTGVYHAGKKAWDWLAAGHVTLLDLPASVKLHPAAERQRRAAREGRRIVEPGLAAALAAFEPPLAVLDFETVNPAIPCWPGCSPYTQVPVQFSVQRHERGAWRETGWIAPRGADPRPACAEALLEACAGARTVLAYFAGFEKGCIGHLARAVPARAPELEALAGRLADLLPVVRDHVYDPAFVGGFGLKKVLPALAGGDGYARLAIAEGASAARELARLLLAPGAPDPGDDARTRAELLEYCAQDTRAVAELLRVLRKLADGD